MVIESEKAQNKIQTFFCKKILLSSAPFRQKLELWTAWIVPVPGNDDAVASSKYINDAVARNRQFTILISDQ